MAESKAELEEKNLDEIIDEEIVGDNLDDSLYDDTVKYNRKSWDDLKKFVVDFLPADLRDKLSTLTNRGDKTFGDYIRTIRDSLQDATHEKVKEQLAALNTSKVSADSLPPTVKKFKALDATLAIVKRVFKRLKNRQNSRSIPSILISAIRSRDDIKYLTAIADDYTLLHEFVTDTGARYISILANILQPLEAQLKLKPNALKDLLKGNSKPTDDKSEETEADPRFMYRSMITDFLKQFESKFGTVFESEAWFAKNEDGSYKYQSREFVILRALKSSVNLTLEVSDIVDIFMNKRLDAPENSILAPLKNAELVSLIHKIGPILTILEKIEFHFDKLDFDNNKDEIVKELKKIFYEHLNYIGHVITGLTRNIIRLEEDMGFSQFFWVKTFGLDWLCTRYFKLLPKQKRLREVKKFYSSIKRSKTMHIKSLEDKIEKKPEEIETLKAEIQKLETEQQPKLKEIKEKIAIIKKEFNKKYSSLSEEQKQDLDKLVKEYGTKWQQKKLERAKDPAQNGEQLSYFSKEYIRNIRSDYPHQKVALKALNREIDKLQQEIDLRKDKIALSEEHIKDYKFIIEIVKQNKEVNLESELQIIQESEAVEPEELTDDEKFPFKWKRNIDAEIETESDDKKESKKAEEPEEELEFKSKKSSSVFIQLMIWIGEVIVGFFKSIGRAFAALGRILSGKSKTADQTDGSSKNPETTTGSTNKMIKNLGGANKSRVADDNDSSDNHAAKEIKKPIRNVNRPLDLPFEERALRMQ